MLTLKQLMAGLERLMAAAAFAEAGCWDTAQGILGEEKRANRKRRHARKRATNDQRPVLRV